MHQNPGFRNKEWQNRCPRPSTQTWNPDQAYKTRNPGPGIQNQEYRQGEKGNQFTIGVGYLKRF